MRLFWCAMCLRTSKFSPTSEYEELEGKRYRVYTCNKCLYLLHVIVD